MTAALASSKSKKNHAGDAFAIGIVFMLAVNILQRAVGFVRGIGFAHFLSDSQLGQWALMNSFLVIAVPFAVLGLPGSFGKFVEYYRTRRQFASYFRAVASVSALGGILVCASVLLTPNAFGYYVLGGQRSNSVVSWCVVALGCTIVFSFTNELVAAFRQVKTVSQMQFALSSTFSVVGVGAVTVFQEWWVLLPSYAVANCVALLPGVLVLYRQHRAEFQLSKEELPAGSVWARIVPYAVLLWGVNLLSNLFEVGDRYMLLHLIDGGGLTGKSLVGQYHCARILPNLLTSIALMLGGVLLPYLSADWEAGRHERIAQRTKQMLQVVCIVSMAVSVGCIVISPLLFGMLLDGRYDLAQSVLAITLMQATWVSLFLVAEPFMLCSEKGKNLIGILAVALCVNLVLNWGFIQVLGLQGAAIATAVSNLLALLLLLQQLGRFGCKVGIGTLILCLLPVSLGLGVNVSAMVLVLIVFAMGRTDWLLTDDDRSNIDEVVMPRLAKLGLKIKSIWP